MWSCFHMKHSILIYNDYLFCQVSALLGDSTDVETAVPIGLVVLEITEFSE